MTTSFSCLFRAKKMRWWSPDRVAYGAYLQTVVIRTRTVPTIVGGVPWNITADELTVS